MWEVLREIYLNLCRSVQTRLDERLAERARTRFWNELREGEREAEAKKRRQ